MLNLKLTAYQNITYGNMKVFHFFHERHFMEKETVYENGWVKCRFRRVKFSDRYLDAHDYGRDHWIFPVRKRKK